MFRVIFAWRAQCRTVPDGRSILQSACRSNKGTGRISGQHNLLIGLLRDLLAIGKVSRSLLKEAESS